MNTKRLFAILLTCAMLCATGTGMARGRRPRNRQAVRPAPPSGPVNPRLVVNEEDERSARRVVLAVGQGTAIYTPSPVRQLVSSIVGAPDQGGVCVSPVCQVENRKATPGNIVYLTANIPGRSANVWIETADGTLMLDLWTVREGDPFTHEVHVLTKAHESAFAAIKSELQSCSNHLGATRRRLDEAETAAKEAATVAKDARSVGFGEGQEAARAESLTVFDSLRIAGKKRRVKGREMIVTEAAPAFRTASGWWAFYRVENRLDEPLTVTATSPAGKAVLSGDDHTIAAKGKRKCVVFVETAGATGPQVAITNRAAGGGAINGGK